MKYNVEVYVQGEMIAYTVSEKETDWEFIANHYDGTVDNFHKQGYKEVYGSTGSNSYSVLFSEKEMKSVTVSCKHYTVSDFKDKNGNNIILDKIYRGKPCTDSDERNSFNRFAIHHSCSLVDEGVYLRNLTRCNSYVVDGNGYTHMSRIVPDKHNFTQEYIDSLELYPED